MGQWYGRGRGGTRGGGCPIGLGDVLKGVIQVPDQAGASPHPV